MFLQRRNICKRYGLFFQEAIFDGGIAQFLYNFNSKDLMLNLIFLKQLVDFNAKISFGVSLFTFQ